MPRVQLAASEAESWQCDECGNGPQRVIVIPDRSNDDAEQ